MTYYSAPGVKKVTVCPVEFTEAMKISFAKDIITSVAKFYDVPMDKVMNKGRKGNVPIVRQMSCYIINEKVKGLNLRTISSLFGWAYYNSAGFDHSAIIHNIKTVKDLLSVNDPIADDYHTLLKII